MRAVRQRHRKPDRRTEAAEAVLEVRAAGQDMVETANGIRYALILGNLQAAMDLAGRAVRHGHQYASYGVVA